MTYHHQWLYLKDDAGSVEVINGARTAAYLANPSLTLTGAMVGDVLEYGGCQAYAYDPPCDADDAYIQFRGGTGNNTTAPDAAALEITPDITLIADIALDDWTPAAKAGVIGRWTTSGQFAYRLSVTTAGALEFQWTTNGTTANTLTSSSNLGSLAAGERRAIRVDFDGNNGASGRTARFWTALRHDGQWEALGTAQTTATATTIFNTGTSVAMFGQAGTDVMIGKLYYAQIRNGMSTTADLGGAAVLTVDPANISDANQLTWSTTTGQTMTVNKSGGTPTVLSIGPNWWEPLTFSTPALDGAPWYSANIPESADVLGFWIEEWTGLDDRHVSRSTVRTARPGGGGQLGMLSSNERVMKLNVLAIARTEKASEYAFRWLASVLGNVCSSCATSSILVRRTCAEVTEDLWEGVAEMREVGLVEGLQWEADAMMRGKCLVRRLSFSLAAGDPCMYLPPYEVAGFYQGDAADCYDALSLASGKATCRPPCHALPIDCRTVFTFDIDAYGAAAPVLTVENDNDAPVPPLRILCYADPDEIGVEPNPCGLMVLGEVYTDVIPPWTTLKWDVAGRRIWYADHTTPGFSPGFRLIEANDPPHKRFFTLPCGTSHIVIEPANVCLDVDTPNSRYTFEGWNFLWSEMHFPSASLEIQERISCA